MTDMQPGWIEVISEPRNYDPDNAVEQINSDQPPVWYKFTSSTSLTNSGSLGSSSDGTYSSPPVTLVTGPFTIDEATTKGLRVAKNANTYPNTTPRLTGEIPSGASFNDLGTYSSLTLYATDDLVKYQPASNQGIKWYLALQASQGQSITNTTYWQEYLPSSSSVPISLPTREPWSIEYWTKYDVAPIGGFSDFNWYSIKGLKQSGSVVWGAGWKANIGGGLRGYYFNYPGWGSFFMPYYHTVSGIQVNDYDFTAWRHIAVTNSGSTSHSSSGRKAFYVDGQLMEEVINGVLTFNGTYSQSFMSADTSGSNNTVTHQPGAVGNVKLHSETDYNIGGTINAANTDIAHLCFYPRELSTDRVRQHYTAAP